MRFEIHAFLRQGGKDTLIFGGDSAAPLFAAVEAESYVDASMAACAAHRAFLEDFGKAPAERVLGAELRVTAGDTLEVFALPADGRSAGEGRVFQL